MRDYSDIISEVKLLTRESSKVFEFPYTSKGYLISQHLPLVKQIFERSSVEMHKLPIGKHIEITGYLELFSIGRLLPKTIIAKWEERFNIKLIGCRTYKFFAETSKIPTEIIIFSEYLERSILDLPYYLKLLKIGEYDCKSFFYLKEYSQSYLKPDKIDFKPLSLKDMIRSLSEIAFLGKQETHVAHSILSGFIGSNFINNSADGIGSSYIYNPQIELDLNILKRAINNTKYGIPLSQFGVVNLLKGDIKEIFDKRIQAYLKLKSISFNIPADRKNPTNIKLSEFKYDIPNLLSTHNTRNIENNFGFLQSLIFYALKNKVISRNIYDTSLLTALKEIKEWTDKIKNENIFKVVDSNRLDEQIGRIASYFSSFGMDEKEINKEIRNTTIQNIESVIEKVTIESIKRSKDIATYKHEKSIPSGIRIAFYSSDKTEQGIIEKTCGIIGCDEKRATEMFNDLVRTGSIFQDIDGCYKWLNESKFRFVQ